MASKFGKGYYDDWESLMVGIKVGLQKAFEMACDRICEGADEIIRGAIYSRNMGETYEPFRTYEMGTIGYMKANVSGTHCEFTFDNKEILSLDIENPPHNQLGYNSPETFMIDVINDYDEKNFVDDVRDYIQREFKNVYRQCCKELKIDLNNN